MKSLKLGLAVLTLGLSVAACAHKPVATTNEQANSTIAPPAQSDIPPSDNSGTASGTTTSLGAPSSGRGH